MHLHRSRRHPKFYFTISALLLALFFTACAGKLGKEKPENLPKSLLWKIEGNNIQPSYLYGTFHLLPKADFIMAEKTKTAFKSAGQVVLELDMDDPKMQQSIMQNALMTDGSSIDKLVSAEDYATLDAAVKTAVGVGIDQFKLMKPIVLTGMLLPQLMEGELASFELTFIKMAGEQEIEILGLETPEQQLAAFDKIPYEDQMEDLMEMLNEKEKMQGYFRQMLETYKAEDIVSLFNMTDENYTPEELDAFLNSRNRDWIPKIGKLAKDKSTFFAVGAGHLGGEQGVIHLLRQAGYSVLPVK